MCKFHKDVAKDIATNADGEFHPGKYAVALMAMAHFRIEQYIPSMFGDDGFVPKRLATPTAQQALKDSGLRGCQHAIARYRDDNIEALRKAIDQTAAVMPLSPADLNIAPGEVTLDGYKATEDAKPDPTINGPFLDHAVVFLLKGYDDDSKKTYVSQGRELSLVTEADDPRFEALRLATVHFISQPDVMPILKQMFEDSLVKTFKAAPEEARLGKGFNKTSGCVMCHEDDRRTAIKKPEPPKR